MGNAALDSSLWEECPAERAAHSAEPPPLGELSAAAGIFFWGLASVALWGILALVVLSAF